MPRRTTIEVLESGPADHPATRAWAARGRRAAVPRSIAVLKDTSTSSVYRVEGVGPGGDPVIAKRSDAATLAVERHLYETILPRLGLPVLQIHGFLGEAGTEKAWLFLEDAGGQAFSPGDPGHDALASRWLGAMHTATARLGLEGLPGRDLARQADELSAARGRIVRSLPNPALVGDDRAVLGEVVVQCDRLAARWGDVVRACSAMPHCLVHGDFVPKNLRVRPSPTGPTLLVFDWEIAGVGVPAPDLGECPDLAEYWSAVRPSWPHLSLAAVERLAACGKLCRWVSAVGWASWGLSDAWAHRPMRSLRCYRDAMCELAHVLEG